MLAHTTVIRCTIQRYMCAAPTPFFQQPCQEVLVEVRARGPGRSQTIQFLGYSEPRDKLAKRAIRRLGRFHHRVIDRCEGEVLTEPPFPTHWAAEGGCKATAHTWRERHALRLMTRMLAHTTVIRCTIQRYMCAAPTPFFQQPCQEVLVEVRARGPGRSQTIQFLGYSEPRDKLAKRAIHVHPPWHRYLFLGTLVPPLKMISTPISRRTEIQFVSYNRRRRSRCQNNDHAKIWQPPPASFVVAAREQVSQPVLWRR